MSQFSFSVLYPLVQLSKIYIQRKRDAHLLIENSVVFLSPLSAKDSVDLDNLVNRVCVVCL